MMHWLKLLPRPFNGITYLLRAKIPPSAFVKFAQKQRIRPLKISTHPATSLAFDALSQDPHMHMLYDSDAFVVLRLLAEHPAPAPATATLPRHGFEIVDKRAGKEVYLDGAWAELFQQELSTWEAGGVSPEEMEAALERYAQLAQFPVLMH